MKFFTPCVFSAIGGMLLSACGVEDRNLPAPPTESTVPLPTTPEAALFTEKCAMCHRHNGMGTGLLARRMPDDQAILENRTNLTSSLIQIAVRQGIGTMPRISRAEVSDAQLRDIERYLLRHGTFNGGTH